MRFSSAVKLKEFISKCSRNVKPKCDRKSFLNNSLGNRYHQTVFLCFHFINECISSNDTIDKCIIEVSLDDKSGDNAIIETNNIKRIIF